MATNHNGHNGIGAGKLRNFLRKPNGPTAFVLSGGGSLGALQVGMLQALLGNGIRPDLVVGTSVGSLNGAWVATDPTRKGADRLAAIWTDISRDDVFHLDPVGGVLGLLGRTNHFFANDNLCSLLKRHMSVEMLEDLPIPLHVVTTDLESGEEVVLSRGSVVDALLASAAIPGVFPPVEIEGKQLADGGIANHTPLSVAVMLGAKRIYVLHAKYPWIQLEKATPMAMALLSVSRIIEQRVAIEIEAFSGQVDLQVVPCSTPLGVSPVDFNRTEELIARARRETLRWLGGPQPPKTALPRPEKLRFRTAA